MTLTLGVGGASCCHLPDKHENDRLVPVTPPSLPRPLRGDQVSRGAWQRGGPGTYRGLFRSQGRFCVLCYDPAASTAERVDRSLWHGFLLESPEEAELAMASPAGPPAAQQ